MGGNDSKRSGHCPRPRLHGHCPRPRLHGHCPRPRLQGLHVLAGTTKTLVPTDSTYWLVLLWVPNFGNRSHRNGLLQSGNRSLLQQDERGISSSEGDLLSNGESLLQRKPGSTVEGGESQTSGSSRGISFQEASYLLLVSSSHGRPGENRSSTEPLTGGREIPFRNCLGSRGFILKQLVLAPIGESLFQEASYLLLVSSSHGRPGENRSSTEPLTGGREIPFRNCLGSRGASFNLKQLVLPPLGESHRSSTEPPTHLQKTPHHAAYRLGEKSTISEGFKLKFFLTASG